MVFAVFHSTVNVFLQIVTLSDKISNISLKNATVKVLSRKFYLHSKCESFPLWMFPSIRYLQHLIFRYKNINFFFLLTHTHTHMHTQMQIHIHIRMHMRARTLTHTHTHTHTQTLNMYS